MNVLVLIGVAAFAMCTFWAAQSVALIYVGEPLALPLQYTTRAPLVRMTSQLMIQVIWIIILVGTPIALGVSPLEALQRAFTLPVPWRKIAIAFLITFIPFCLGYALYIKAQWLRFEPKYDQATRRRKLLTRFLTPIPLAVLEEGVFRGTLLEQLLRSLPPAFIPPYSGHLELGNFRGRPLHQACARQAGHSGALQLFHRGLPIWNCLYRRRA